VDHRQHLGPDRDVGPVEQGIVNPPIGVHHLPQHRVVGMQQDGCSGGIGQVGGGIDVVVVAVGAHDGRQPPATEGVEDGPVIVGRVDHDGFVPVADQPHIVLNLEVVAIEAEDPGGDDPVDHSTTTERSTSPRSILWNASSTASSPMVSDTKPSRLSRP
jgi:hypothetical protein